MEGLPFLCDNGSCRTEGIVGHMCLHQTSFPGERWSPEHAETQCRAGLHRAGLSQDGDRCHRPQLAVTNSYCAHDLLGSAVTQTERNASSPHFQNQGITSDICITMVFRVSRSKTNCGGRVPPALVTAVSLQPRQP